MRRVAGRRDAYARRSPNVDWRPVTKAFPRNARASQTTAAAQPAEAAVKHRICRVQCACDALAFTFMRACVRLKI